MSEPSKKAEGSWPEVKSKHSLVCKHLTSAVYDKHKAHKTKTSGCTLDDCIRCAVDLDNQHVGIYAGDEDCYKDFGDLFLPIIKEYHNMNELQHKSDLDPAHLKSTLSAAAADSVISTRIRVGRNIVGYGLSPGILKQHRLAVEDLMKEAFARLDGELKGTYYSLATMDEEARKKLVDDHLLFVSGDVNLRLAGMERDWPEGRGIFLNDDKTFVVWVNEEDQLRIISMQNGGDVHKVYSRLINGINAIEAYLKTKGKEYQYCDELGYIHSCPSNLGTGMRASVHIDLNALSNKLGAQQFKDYCKSLKLQARGTRGESGGDTQGIYDISNRHRLGYTEVQLVDTMIDGVNKLFNENKN